MTFLYIVTVLVLLVSLRQSTVLLKLIERIERLDAPQK